MSAWQHGTWQGGMRGDVFDTLEARGRVLVTRLATRWAAERRAGDPAYATTGAAFAQARAYQALLVGHVDFARRPCRPQDERALVRGHVELILAVLRLMDDLNRGPGVGRTGDGA